MSGQFWVVTIATSAIIAMAQVEATNYGDAGKRGWYWYEEPPEPIEEPENAEPVTPQTPREQLKAKGEAWENAAALAILHSTPENVADYLRRTQQITQQAGNFAAAGQQLIWTEPEFAYAGRGRPTSIHEQLAYAEVQDKERNQAIEKIRETKGLVYYFTSTCPYCRKFTPLLKQFVEQHDITIIPVSLDGQGVPEFPYPKKDFHLGRKLEVTGVPSVFMVDPDSNEVAKVSYGYTSESGFIERLMSALKRMEEEP
ncbi:conjugal transfer protein TraF [uncultured Microbulbifer sp.]|uniref:conjugal transfer protein TraF n=1 Tax=uncultured Microbulbifer sp. TaxID=348147 RepID=UPI002631266B|nr:conjugal transfer protein TraF [uncultured Microbulbifer sp.]